MISNSCSRHLGLFAGLLTVLILVGCGGGSGGKGASGSGSKSEPENTKLSGPVKKPKAGAEAKEDGGTNTALTLTARRLTDPPKIDGVAEEAWNAFPELKMTAKRKDAATEISLKAAHDGKTFFLLASWPDPDASEQHKPWTWSDAEKKYVAGKDREDRIAFEMAMSDTFHACMLGGTPYVADVWHWKAARTNPSGRVDDAWHKVALQPFKVDDAEAEKYEEVGPDRKSTLYMLRVKDKGQRAYTSQKAPEKKGEAQVAKYVPQETSGGQAEVAARGVWKDGTWTVEFARALSVASKEEDLTLEVGQAYPFAIAVFDKVSVAPSKPRGGGRREQETSRRNPVGSQSHPVGLAIGRKRVLHRQS